MSSRTVVVADVVPCVPLIVSVADPGGVDGDVWTVKTDEDAAGFGENEAVAPGGSPLRLRSIAPVKPFCGVIVTS